LSCLLEILPAERGDRDRYEREPEPDADQQEAGQKVAKIGAVFARVAPEDVMPVRPCVREYDDSGVG